MTVIETTCFFWGYMFRALYRMSMWNFYYFISSNTYNYLRSFYYYLIVPMYPAYSTEKYLSDWYHLQNLLYKYFHLSKYHAASPSQSACSVPSILAARLYHHKVHWSACCTLLSLRNLRIKLVVSLLEEKWQKFNSGLGAFPWTAVSYDT